MRAPAIAALSLVAALGAGTAALAADGTPNPNASTNAQTVTGKDNAPGQLQPKTGDAAVTETAPVTTDGTGTTTPTTALAPATAPVLGRSASVAPAGGEVRVKLPGSDHYVDLSDASSVPMGATLDASHGAVRLTSARDASGTPQTATFRQGAFTLRQASSAAGPVTELVLRGGDFSSCGQSARAARAAAPPKRLVWGSGHGRFRTRGRNSAATVRGTIWMTEDTCAGTRTVVKRGVVAVYDRGKGRTVMVRAGHEYLAKPAHLVLVGTEVFGGIS